MATTYRYSINDDDFRTRDQIKPHGKFEVKRDSKKAESEALAMFVARLSTIVPWGPNAKGHLERSDKYGLEILYRVNGIVTHTRLGRDGHSKVPAGGNWVNAKTGEILAFAGSQS